MGRNPYIFAQLSRRAGRADGEPMWLRRARLCVPAGAVAASAAFALQRTSAKALCDLQELPAFAAQSRPTAPYPAWDDNWDHCELRPQDVAKRLGHEWSTPDSHVKAIHRLYAEHTDKDRAKVDAVIKDHEDDLPSLYKRAYLRYAHGGAVTRHIILVRHGQYDEQRALSKRLHAVDPDGFGRPGDPLSEELDAARVLTPRGRIQAEKVGDRLAAMLKPALTTPGREAHVRIHVSTLARAKETAAIIASRLPAHVRQPDPNLAEGDPAHTVPFQARGGVEHLVKHGKAVWLDSARIEAAFRSLFYRGLPAKKKPPGSVPPALGDPGLPRHEYEVVVCHMNVIRFFVMRALQLPPEAWLRLGGYNSSITHLQIRGSGSVSLVSFGDHGHLSLEETTFGMYASQRSNPGLAAPRRPVGSSHLRALPWTGRKAWKTEEPAR